MTRLAGQSFPGIGGRCHAVILRGANIIEASVLAKGLWFPLDGTQILELISPARGPTA